MGFLRSLITGRIEDDEPCLTAEQAQSIRELRQIDHVRIQVDFKACNITDSSQMPRGIQVIYKNLFFASVYRTGYRNMFHDDSEESRWLEARLKYIADMGNHSRSR